MRLVYGVNTQRQPSHRPGRPKKGEDKLLRHAMHEVGCPIPLLVRWHNGGSELPALPGASECDPSDGTVRELVRALSSCVWLLSEVGRILPTMT